MTSNEQRFNNFVKDAISKYKHAVEAKSSKNTIKHSNATLKLIKQAIELAAIINVKEKVPYLHEYATLSYALIAEAYYEKKDFISAIEYYNKAQEANKKTLGNQETVIRDSYLLKCLMNLAKFQKNWRIADKFAQKIFISSKKIENPSKALQYLMEIKDIFIESKNLDYINKSYKRMLKICQSKEAKKDLRKTIAEVYADYAKYLNIVLKKDKTAIKYFQKAKEIYLELNMKPEEQIIKNKIQQIS